MTRCSELLRYPLTPEERDYIQDLQQRISSGRAPLLVDWFRSKEILSKYKGDLSPGNGNGRPR